MFYLYGYRLWNLFSKSPLIYSCHISRCHSRRILLNPRRLSRVLGDGGFKLRHGCFDYRPFYSEVEFPMRKDRSPRRRLYDLNDDLDWNRFRRKRLYRMDRFYGFRRRIQFLYIGGNRCLFLSRRIIFGWMGLRKRRSRGMIWILG